MSQVASPQPRVTKKESSPDLAVVKAPHRSLGVTTVIIGMLAVFVLFGVVGFQALIVRNQNDLDQLTSRVHEEQRVNQRLRLQVAELKSPERIRFAAIATLGMVQPAKVTYLEPIAAEELAPPDGDPG